METEQEPFAKQYMTLKDVTQNEIDEDATVTRDVINLSNVQFPAQLHSLEVSSTEDYQVLNNYSIPESSCTGDEPIDLTTFSNKEITNLNETAPLQTKTFTLTPCSQGRIIFDQPNDYYPKRRRRRRKFAYTADGKLILVPNDETLQSPASFSESKQMEILKAAKSLFSKRTRTLYHWMYPNAAKQQIKTAVASSWDSLGAQEKDFYISQVLGRFGFPQSSLMVNPQLGGIKELPPIPDIPENKIKSRELQSAISSITPENPLPPGVANNALTFEEFEEMNELTKKRRGRPPGSSNKKQKFNLANGTLAQDFKDDPELSQELEQFATMFNLSKI
ncbi:hypothetical protein NQ318_006537 [Aromia moschata]|uniref:Uncharacterized protein n=1 Tax=Aromia moschata TaxID=1265417 RepID=A0AAV8YNN6_9CUCU|nr:hypothetical protein NQ318_006537 [Aromia moschata]